MTAAQAIARSISHNEIVTVDYDTATVRALAKVAESSGESDSCSEYWGTTDDGEWRVHVRHVSEDRIEALRLEAVAAGDEDQETLCRLAIAGDARAMKRCVAAIDAAADMSND